MAVTLGLAEPVVAALLALVVIGERLSAPAIGGLILVGLALAILVMPAAPPPLGGRPAREHRAGAPPPPGIRPVARR